MLSSGMCKGALITREAYLALLDLRSLVESAVEKAHKAGLDTVGLTVSPHSCGDPVCALRVAAQTLHSRTFDSALADARTKIETALAWHKKTTTLQMQLPRSRRQPLRKCREEIFPRIAGFAGKPEKSQTPMIQLTSRARALRGVVRQDIR